MADYGKFSPVLRDDVQPEAAVAFYALEAPEYETDMGSYFYQGAKKVAEVFFSLNISKDAKILDVLCGTGLVAEQLKTKGYLNMDGIDGAPEMLEIARKQQLYKNYITALIERKGPIPLSDETYDVLIMSGGMAPGHLYPTIFPEFIRITKHGGLILWSMGTYHINVSDHFKDIDDKVKELSSEWEHCLPTVSFENYYMGMEGRVYVMKRL